MRRSNFWTGLAGVIVGALLVTALPAVSQDAGDRASPGDPFLLGLINIVNERSVLRGDAGARSNLVVRNTGGASPLALQTAGSSKPPLIVDSRGKVRSLNADLLDSRHANGLIRAAFDSTNNAPDTDGDAVTATITAPQPGVLIMGASIDAFGTAFDFYGCQLEVNGSPVTQTLRTSTVHRAGADHTSNSDEDCSTDGGLIVEKGTHTVALNITGRNTAGFSAASVWVIWSPFGGDGRVPSLTDNPTTDTDAADVERRTQDE